MSDNEESPIDPEVLKLLTKYSASREKLEDYVGDVEVLRTKVSAIFPQDLNYRNKFVIEDKLKVMASFYSTLLNIRQEINKSLKDEVEIRRKLQPADKGKEKKLDIREFADQLEAEMKFRNSTKISLEPDKDVSQSEK